ncbi:L-dopachrome tautomerase-related protein [Kozakia baliensis]|uniref:Uncharacterized protein n=1 Tax=Kozakia baliensis TaxID=153496 RepID=A0A1D8UWG3_9PROT|nr:L-dopachrome tautomerase-related protein [Kozakia baliensis]AOX18025.1 hypothetical protein A0U89_01130 [Kozakia baliensis]GEL64141.1 yellow [Kozakia baliensis]
MTLRRALSILAVLTGAPLAACADIPITPVFSSPLLVNGVMTTAQGRMFVVVQPQHRPDEPQLSEVKSGRVTPYPDALWNSWIPGQSAVGRFVGVNSARLGPDGALWVVDRGSEGLGSPQIPGAARLIRIDISQAKVTRVYDLEKVISSQSFVDDVRFNSDHAYLTDAGQPGLIVLDLASGNAWREFDGDKSVTVQRPMRAEGKDLRFPDGDPVKIHADQLEVSQDGQWLYFQPASGPMSRIQTRLLDHAVPNDSSLPTYVQPYADTNTTGGTAMAANGTIYASDTDRSSILAIGPNGKIRTLFADPRLAWVDAMWIDEQGNLLMPAVQINRTPTLNHGRNDAKPPFIIYRAAIGAQPVRR